MKKLILLILIATATTNLLAQNLYNGLIIYYPMNGDFIDASGNSYDAAAQNGVTPTIDRFGNPNSAMNFDGIDDFVNLPNILALKPNLPVTISFWINIPSLQLSSNRWFASEDTYNVYSGFFVQATADNLGRVTVGYGDGGTQSSQNRRNKLSNTSLTTGSWNHIVCVVRGEADMDIYINCVNSGGTYSGTGAPAVNHIGTAGTMGHASGNSLNSEAFFNGIMDDFAFWNRELSISEIVDVCNNGLYTGITENTKAIKINAFPNPTKENIELNFSENQKEIEIKLLNNLGQNISSSIHNNTNKVVMDLSSLPSGFYFVKIKTDKGLSELKIVKE